MYCRQPLRMSCDWCLSPDWMCIVRARAARAPVNRPVEAKPTLKDSVLPKIARIVRIRGPTNDAGIVAAYCDIKHLERATTNLFVGHCG